MSKNKINIPKIFDSTPIYTILLLIRFTEVVENA